MHQAEVFLAPAALSRRKDLDQPDLEYNIQATKEAVYWARYEGDRIVVNGNTVWLGILSNAGEDKALEEVWSREGDKLIETLKDLPRGTVIEVKTYRPDRRPSWIPLKSFTLR